MRSHHILVELSREVGNAQSAACVKFYVELTFNPLTPLDALTHIKSAKPEDSLIVFPTKRQNKVNYEPLYATHAHRFDRKMDMFLVQRP